LFFVLLDIAGTVSFAIGVMWFYDAPRLISSFPAGTLGAVAAIACGFLLMAVAASRILALLVLNRGRQAEGAGQ
jgi:hypothetical protein